MRDLRTWPAPDGSVVSYAAPTFGSNLRGHEALRHLSEQDRIDHGQGIYGAARVATCIVSCSAPAGPLPVGVIERLRWALDGPEWLINLLRLIDGDGEIAPEEERSTSATSAPPSSPTTSSAPSAPRRSSADASSRPRRRGR